MIIAHEANSNTIDALSEQIDQKILDYISGEIEGSSKVGKFECIIDLKYINEQIKDKIFAILEDAGYRHTIMDEETDGEYHIIDWRYVE